MNLRIERIYGSSPNDGEFRVLVDRIWPRGISKEKAKIDYWAKDIAPSTELRKWFDHIPEKYPEFHKKYLAEITKNPAVNELIKEIKNHKSVVILYGAKDEKHNQAVVLKEYLKQNI